MRIKVLPLSRQMDLVVQEFEKELLVYDLNINKAFVLNETCAKVYQACDGKTLIDELKRKTNFTNEIIFLALDELQKTNLIPENSNYVSPFAGMKRREVIRKVGLASLIALPLISSVVAPTAAMAQSGPTNLALLDVCSASPQCTSGNCWQVTSGGKQCCVSTAQRNVPIFGGNAVAGQRLPGCYSDQGSCNTSAPLSCCSGNAAPIVFDNGCVNPFNPGIADYACYCA